jgi:EmrB/QacA subfamily drug resistance transporter
VTNKEMIMARASAAPAAEPSSEEAGDSRRWLILATVCTAYAMVGLDLTVMNVALPSAQRALGFSTADRQWVVTAYALAFGSLLLFSGRLADRIGRKESFLISMVGFAVASAVGGASTSFAMLVTARACQGAFASLMAPSCLAVMAATFTDESRGKAFGIFSSVAASATALGLIIGGALVSGLNWRWCLYVNLIFAAVAFTGGLRLLSRQPRSDARTDIPGVILASGGMFCVVYGFGNAASHNWHTPSTWGFLVVGGVLLAVFAAWQARSEQPLLPLRIVLDRTRGGAYLAVLLQGAGIFGVLLFLVYYMQSVLGYSAITSGAALLPLFVCTTLAAAGGGTKLLPRFGPKPLIAGGLLIGAAGMAWLTTIGVDSSYAANLLGPLIVVGFGMGFIFAAALSSAVAGVEVRDAGIASACASTGQQIGGAIGAALLNSIAAAAVTNWLTDHVHGAPSPGQARLASVHSFVTVFWWSAAIFAVGAIITALLLRNGPLPAGAGGHGAPAAEPSEAPAT